MSEGKPEPPDPPRYAHPDTAGKAEAVTSDGARWRWTGQEWNLIAAPGTNADVVHRHEGVMPLLELAISLARNAVPAAEGAKRLWATEGCSHAALRDVYGLLESTSVPLHDRANAFVEAALGDSTL